LGLTFINTYVNKQGSYMGYNWTQKWKFTNKTLDDYYLNTYISVVSFSEFYNSEIEMG